MYSTHICSLSCPHRLVTDYMGALNVRDIDFSESPVNPEQLVDILHMLADGNISGVFSWRRPLAFARACTAAHFVKEEMSRSSRYFVHG